MKTYYFTYSRVTNVQFPYAFYLLGAGTGAAPAPVFFDKRLRSQEAENMRLLPTPAPQP